MSKRNRISDNQREILEDFYGKGMVGTGAMYKEMVEKAAADTGLTKAQVEKWIGNQKRKRSPQETNADVTLKRIKAARGPHSYNLFCAEFFKTDECKGLTYEEKNKRASEKWKLQTKEEKEKYEKSAKAFKELDAVKISELSEEQRKKLIERHRKKLLEEIMVLEDLGCQASVLYLDVSGEVFHMGSRDGTSFLASNQDISLKFREYFGSDKHHFSVSDVQGLFNKKYSEACGKQGCRVPYLKGGFEVHGLPEGISFKKPYNYGRLQLKQIMLAADTIYFTVASNQPQSDEPDGGTESGPSNPRPTDDILPVLTKIAGEDVAKRALDGQGQIEEADVEVVDLCLSATEKLTLYVSCSPFFLPDAWLSVGVNMKHSDDASSLVLPIYTTADEPFWLFHTISKPSRIMKAVSTTKIRGHWLDLQDDGSYSVINNDTVLGKNIIRTAHGPLYFECTINVDPEFSFHLPVAIRSVILGTLRQAGLICST